MLVFKRYLRYERNADCVMCHGTGVRGPTCPGHRYAVLPGGHVEPGESPETAAVRELEEETTLTATIGRLLWTAEHNGRPAFYYLMTDVAGTARLSGPEAAENSPNNSYELLWAEPADFVTLGLYPPDAPTRLRELLAR